MRLSAPKNITWFIGLVLAVIGLLGGTGLVAALSGYAFWFAFVAAVLMLLATFFKGL